MSLVLKNNIKHGLSLFIVLLAVITVMFMPSVAADPIYNPGDIAVINAIITNNSLNWTKANPADGSYVPGNWTGVTWSGGATNKRITGLTINNKGLTGTLNVGGLTNLQTLYCWSNILTELDVRSLANLEYLYCDRNLLTKLDVRGLTNLRYLYCDRNVLTELDVRGLANLEFLNCNDNALTELNVRGLTKLRYLYCDKNVLTELDVRGLANLEFLNCNDNALTKLNVSGLTNLKILECNGNAFTELDVRGLANLEFLNCNDNALAKLNVSSLTNLEFLECYYNALTELDVSGCTSLQVLLCPYNALTKLVLNATAPYWCIYVDNNYLPNTSAIIGRNDITWDIDDFIFSPQKSVTGTGYSITGKVISVAGDKRPATVTLKQNGNTKYTTYTNQNGEYAFNNVTPGVYTLVITKTSYLSYTKNLLKVNNPNNPPYKDVTLIPGDIDGDGYVNYNDFLIFLANYNKQGAGILNPAADVNGDRYVDYNDFITFLSGYGKAAVVEP